MTTHPRIFVSHSSADKQLTADVCAQLALDGDPRFELLVDVDRLEAGHPWPKQLHEWMARCDAALILLTPAAAGSDWVLKEATILAWRLALEPGFRLFIARHDDVSDELLAEQKFGPLQLDQVQWLGAGDPAGIAGEVRAGLAGLSFDPSPFDRMVGVLAELFEEVGTSTLGKVAAKLKSFEPPPWAPETDEKQRLIEAIARHLMCENLGDYEEEGLKSLIGDIGWKPTAKVLRGILRILAPHWVDGGAAGQLALLPRLDPRRAAALNGEYLLDYTARIYVTRALLDESLKCQVFGVPGANSGQLDEHYRHEICNAVRSRKRRLKSRDDAAVIAWLKRQDADRYVVLPPPVPPGAAIATLLDTFPTVNFVIWTGRDLEIDPSLPRVDWLEPAVDPETEEKQYDDWDDSTQIIEEAEHA